MEQKKNTPENYIRYSPNEKTKDTEQAREHRNFTKKKQYGSDTQYHKLASDQLKKNRRNQKLKPHTKTKTLKSFLGTIPFFAKFIPNISETTDNMRQLLKNGKKWDWTMDGNTDFNKIKQELTKLPCLENYNENKENIVTTDASKTGLGIALSQKQGNNELKLIAFASRYLNDADKNTQSVN